MSTKLIQWNDFESLKKHILNLTRDLITPQVIQYLKDNPPKYIVEDDLGWLNKAIAKFCEGVSLPIDMVLRQRMVDNSYEIKVYHACRPHDVTAYYENGFKILSDEELISDFKRTLFACINETTPSITHEKIDEILSTHKLTRGEKGIYFAFDVSLLIEVANHYLKYGSEAMWPFLRRLTNETAGNYDFELLIKNKTKPTIFECNIPVKMVPGEQAIEFAAVLLQRIFCHLRTPQDFERYWIVRSHWIMIFHPSI